MRHERGEQGNVVSRPDERLGAIDWPCMEEFDLGAIDVGDAVILCGGFEDRASCVLERLVEGRRKGAVVVLVEYLPEYEVNRDLKGLAKGVGMEVRGCQYDRRSPAGGGEKLVELVKGAGRVHVDISGMSRLLIVQVIVALLQARLPTTIVYGEAAEYLPVREDFERQFRSVVGEANLDFLSSGVFEVAATPELGSVAMVGEATRLVVFPSFEMVQLKNLLQELQPTYVDVIYGVPPADENRWRRSALQRLNAGALKRQTGISSHEVSTLDYRETLSVLLNIYARRILFDRVLVAPTGSKMQAVAVGIVRAVLTDIQVVYPTPKNLRTASYTRGLRRTYQLRVPSVVEL